MGYSVGVRARVEPGEVGVRVRVRVDTLALATAQPVGELLAELA